MIFRRTTFLLCAFLLCASTQSAVLTVDNNPGSVAMYKDVWVAYNGAAEGDTLLIAGSPNSYSILGSVAKKLNWVGNGYFLVGNQIPGISQQTTKIAGKCRFSVETNGSAAGSTLTGIHFEQRVRATVPISFDRCLFTDGIDDYYFDNATQQSYYGQITVRRSYISRIFDSREASHLNSPGSILVNSIVATPIAIGAGTAAANCVFLFDEVYIDVDGRASVTSSVFDSLDLAISDFPHPANPPPGSITYSIGINGKSLPPGTGNINGEAKTSDVFVSVGSTDARLQLKPGSPAIGKGLDGVDMGAFGGPTPYILSGLPSRPRISSLSVPPVADRATGLRFEVTAVSP